MCEFKIGDCFLRQRDKNTSASAVATIIGEGLVKFRFLTSGDGTYGHFHFKIISPNRILNPGTSSEWVYVEPFEADLLLATVNQ
jgi:hypothetical protein